MAQNRPGLKPSPENFGFRRRNGEIRKSSQKLHPKTSFAQNFRTLESDFEMEPKAVTEKVRQNFENFGNQGPVDFGYKNTPSLDNSRNFDSQISGNFGNQKSEDFGDQNYDDFGNQNYDNVDEPSFTSQRRLESLEQNYSVEEPVADFENQFGTGFEKSVFDQKFPKPEVEDSREEEFRESAEVRNPIRIRQPQIIEQKLPEELDDVDSHDDDLQDEQYQLQQEEEVDVEPQQQQQQQQENRQLQSQEQYQQQQQEQQKQQEHLLREQQDRLQKQQQQRQYQQQHEQLQQEQERRQSEQEQQQRQRQQQQELERKQLEQEQRQRQYQQQQEQDQRQLDVQKQEQPHEGGEPILKKMQQKQKAKQQHRQQQVPQQEQLPAVDAQVRYLTQLKL